MIRLQFSVMNTKPLGTNDPAEQIKQRLCALKLYFTKIGCCPASISLSDAVFMYKGIADQDREYLRVDFWESFAKRKKVVKHKLKELKGNEDDYPPDIEASLGTFDFIMDALKSLSEEYIEAVIDNLCDYQREINSNVWIAHESVCSSAGSSRCYCP